MPNVLLSTKAAGSIVKLNVSGSPKNFVIAQQGRPATGNYDTSFDNVTWLLMQDIYDQRQWDGSNNDYKNSGIHSWLNGTFLNLFDENIRNAIKQVKIPYHNGTGSGGSVASGANGLSCKIFLLSGYELGWTKSDNSYFPQDGAKLDYFTAGTGSAANKKRIAKYNGSATYWWTRSPNTNGSDDVWGVYSDGSYYSWDYSNTYGVRPAFVLPSNLYVSDDGSILTNEPPTAPGSIDVTNTVAGGTATITLTAATDPDGTIASYRYERSVDGGQWQQFADVNSLTQTDQIGEDWGTVAYRACAVDDAGVAGPYVTSETETVNTGYLLIGGPVSNMGVKSIPFDFEATVGVSGEASVTGIEATMWLDHTQVYHESVNQGATLEYHVDTRVMSSGQHTIQVTLEKEDYLPANTAYYFTVPSQGLPDGGMSVQLEDDQGNPLFTRTTTRDVIGPSGKTVQNEIEDLQKAHLGTTGHLEHIDTVLGPASNVVWPREANTAYACRLYTSGTGNYPFNKSFPSGFTGSVSISTAQLNFEAAKITLTALGSNDMYELLKYVLDTHVVTPPDLTVNFTPLDQPKVLTAATNTGTTATDLQDALQQIMDTYPTQNLYMIEDAVTNSTVYYVACVDTIDADTTSKTCAYVVSTNPTKWYQGVQLTFLDTSNVQAAFTYLSEPEITEATTSNSVSAGSSLNETLISMIKAQPTYYRYRMYGGDITYYVLSSQVINANAASAENVLYCTASGTYYNNETLTLNVEASFEEITSRKIYQVSSGDPATHVGNNLQETLNAMLKAYPGRHAYAIERDGEGTWYILTTSEVNETSKQVTDAVYCADPGVYYTQGTLKFGFDLSHSDFTAVDQNRRPAYINGLNFENQSDANALKPKLYIWSDEDSTDDVLSEVGYIDPEGIKNYPYRYYAYHGQNWYFFTKISSASEFKRLMQYNAGVSDMLELANYNTIGGPFYTLSENGPFQISCYD